MLDSSFSSSKLRSTYRESCSSSCRQSSLLICGGCYSDGEIVVEDLATSSLVSSSFLATKSIRVRRKPSQTCQYLLQSYTHHRKLWESCIPHQTIQTNRPIEQWLIFRGRVFKTVTPNSSVQRLTRSQRYTEHCKPVVYQSYMLQDEKLAGYSSNPQIRVSSKTANIDEYGFSRGSPHIVISNLSIWHNSSECLLVVAWMGVPTP